MNITLSEYMIVLELEYSFNTIVNYFNFKHCGGLCSRSEYKFQPLLDKVFCRRYLTFGYKC